MSSELMVPLVLCAQTQFSSDKEEVMCLTSCSKHIVITKAINRSYITSQKRVMFKQKSSIFDSLLIASLSLRCNHSLVLTYYKLCVPLAGFIHEKEYCSINRAIQMENYSIAYFYLITFPS